MLDEAAAAGVNELIQVSTDVDTARWSLQLVEQAHPHVSIYPSAGLYPTRAKGDWPAALQEIQALLDTRKFCAVGECGLDRFHDVSYFDQQLLMFDAQLRIAIEKDLPLIVHCRQAAEQVLEAVSHYRGESRLRGVWHCFDGTLAEAEAMIELGFYISFSGIVTFKTNDALREVAAALPRDKVLAETDSPYLTPVPIRGRPNQPAHVCHIGQVLAGVWNLEQEAAWNILVDNTRRLFSLKKPSP